MFLSCVSCFVPVSGPTSYYAYYAIDVLVLSRISTESKFFFMKHLCFHKSLRFRIHESRMVIGK